MARFYTKTGDDGYTSLIGKGRTAKHAPRIETIGAIDEANAAIALARTLCQNSQTSPILMAVQKDLYHLMAEVAATPENALKYRVIDRQKVIWLESTIDFISTTVNIPSEFIIPGDSKAGAAIDLARTIVRRAERHIALLFHSKELENPELLHYLNRLSSLCFVLELLENQTAGIDQTTTTKE